MVISVTLSVSVRTGLLGTQQASSPKLDRRGDDPKPSLPPENKIKVKEKI